MTAEPILPTLGQRNDPNKTGQWSAVEAVAWIATHDMKLVSGLSRYQTDLGWPVEARMVVAIGALDHDIGSHYCLCGKPLQHPSLQRRLSRWLDGRSLRTALRSPPNGLKPWMVIADVRKARERRCVCVATAERTLLGALAAGEVQAQALREDGPSDVPRAYWEDMEAGPHSGSVILSPKMKCIYFDRSAVRRRWRMQDRQKMGNHAVRRPASKEELIAFFRSARATKRNCEKVAAAHFGDKFEVKRDLARLAFDAAGVSSGKRGRPVKNNVPKS